jgi:hypothetical protein
MFAATPAISDADPDMAKAYRRGRGTSAINWWFQTLTRLGFGASYRHILTVPGRRTGQLHSVADELRDGEDARASCAAFY